MNKTIEFTNEEIVKEDHDSTVVLVLVISVIGLIYLLNMKNIPFQTECPVYVKFLYVSSISIFLLSIMYTTFFLIHKNY